MTMGLYAARNQIAQQQAEENAKHFIETEGRFFIFPIQGLSLDSEVLKFGYVHFIKAHSLLEEYPKTKDYFPSTCKTLAKVDLAGINPDKELSFQEKYELALKLTKEAIGALHIFSYKKFGIAQEKKITINSNSEIEVEAGLNPFIFLADTGDFVSKKIQYNKGFILNEKELDEIPHSWTVLFNTRYDLRSNLNTRVFKALEIMYYACNDIHAYVRMLHFFIILNHICRSNETHDLDCGGMQRISRNIIQDILGNNPFNENYNTEFNNLYQRMRNKPLHGILDENEEFGPVESDDYRPLQNIIMTMITFYVEDDRVNSLATVEELTNTLTNIIRTIHNR